MSTPTERMENTNNKSGNIKIENDYQREGSEENEKKPSVVDFHHQKNQMSAIEEEDRQFLNSNTEAMTISQIDNYLMHSTTQGDINNLTNINIAEQINNITDADLRKLLMRYDTEEVPNNQNANDLSYSNISQLQQSLSNFIVDSKDDYSNQGNILSGIKGNSMKGDGMQFQFEKSSKYFLKFLNGDNLNDSSMMQSTSMLSDNPQSQRTQSKDMKNVLSDLNPNNLETHTLRTQLIESTQRYKQTLVQNKILIDGYEKLKQQVDDLTKQVNNNHFQSGEISLSQMR